MKVSNLKKKLHEIIIDIYFRLFLKKKLVKGNKILITSTDGIGDVIIRQKLALEFLKKYGSEDIVILCVEKTKPLFEKMGFENILIYTKDYRKRVNGKIEMIKTIRSMGINKVVALEFNPYDIYIKYLPEMHRYSFKNKKHPKMEKYYDEFINRKGDKVLEDVKSYLEGYFNIEASIDEIRPDFSTYCSKVDKYRSSITIGIGANDKEKIISPIFMGQTIGAIKDITDKKVVLLGYGEREEEIANEILRLSKNNNIENLVGKMSLDETLNVINSSELYIGLDSGLYNFAFSLNKPLIAFFQEKHFFAHIDFDNVNILTGKEDIRNSEFIDDGRYGTYELNNISIIKVKEVLKKNTNIIKIKNNFKCES